MTRNDLSETELLRLRAARRWGRVEEVSREIMGNRVRQDRIDGGRWAKARPDALAAARRDLSTVR